MDNISFSYRLGLSATIPEKRRPEVEKYIGRIRHWHWSDPEIETYMPDWIGEVYEADLDESESEALGVIRSLPSGGFTAGLLERYLSRDGTLALVETLQKQGKLGKRFGPAILPLLQDNPDRMHKFQVLKQLLNDHDFRKAIVFVERRTVAVHLAEQFKSLNPVLFLGRGKVNQEQALKQVKLPETRLIIATSAGEEGIDLPEADLLVAWGSVTSEIRFIQRHGRIMRKAGNGLKFATFIVTPGTSDFDSFVKGLERAQASGQINIEEAFGWEPSILWPKTTWWHVTESLRGQGQPLKTIGETLGVREQVAYRVIQGAIKRGRIFYIYDVANIATSIARWYLTWYAQFPDIRPIAPRLSSLAKEFSDSPSPLVLSRAIAALLASCPPEIAGSLVKRLRPKFSKFSPKVLNGANTAGDKSKGERISRQRIHLLSEDAQHVAQFLPSQVASCEKFSEEPSVNIVIPMCKTKKGGLDKRILSGLWLYGESVKQFWETSIRAEWDDDTPGYTIGFRSPTLEYYFFPRIAEVFAATIDNMCGLLRWRDILTVALNKCSRCGSHGAWTCPHCSEVLCANCWESEAGYGRLCWQLEEFGKPVMKEV